VAPSPLNSDMFSRTSSLRKRSLQTPRETPGGSSCGKLKEHRMDVQAFRVRCQLYRQAFNVLDENCSGQLDMHELDKFGGWMLGNDWTSALCEAFMKSIDKNGDTWVSEEEFIDFCESALLAEEVSDPDDASASTREFIEPMVQGFLQMVELRQSQIVAIWQSRAAALDLWCRWILCGSYSVVLLVFSQVSFEAAAADGSEGS